MLFPSRTRVFAAGATSALFYLYRQEQEETRPDFFSLHTYAEEKYVNKSTAWSFGNNLFGQLGIGNFLKQIYPQPVDTLSVKSVHANFDQTAFITDDGTLYTCGCSSHGRLGHGKSDSNKSIPQKVVSLNGRHVDSVAVGGFHMVCLVEGDVYTFGRNNYNQLGHNNPSPGDATKIEDCFDKGTVVAVAAGRMHSCAILDDGSVWTWGCGKDGALGHGSRSDENPPKKVEKLAGKRVVDIDAGNDYTICVVDDGTVYSWGRDGCGQLGQGSQERLVLEPKRGSMKEKETRVAAGNSHVLAISDHGKLFSWGEGNSAQLGHGKTNNLDLPTEISSIQNVVSASAGNGHSGAVTDAGKCFLWGKGRHGQLASSAVESNAARRLVPVEVRAFEGKRVVQVSCGGEHTLVLSEDIEVVKASSSYW